MTSSTSSSDADRRLRRWVVAFLATFLGGAGLLYAVLILFDPYDTGRFVTLGLAGVSDGNLRTADVSRGRDLRFDSAIFGSSTAMSLSPQRLSAATGLHFVQLSITQAGPPEMLALMRWFVSHRTHVGALIVVADAEWCSADTGLDVRYPFPFWLYGDDATYLAHVLNWKTFDRVAWRLQMVLGKRPPNDPVGYFPFHPLGTDDSYHPLPPRRPELGPPGAPFPWVTRLQNEIARLPTGASVVILMPPVVQDFLPPAGSEEAARVASCKSALAGLVARRSRSWLIDDRVDTPLAHDTTAFFDRVHYRPDYAPMLEAQIVAVLTGEQAVRPLALRGPAEGETR